MIWPNGAKCAFNLGFDLDGETIWRNKARRLPGALHLSKGHPSGHMVLIRERPGFWRSWRSFI